MHLEHGRFPVLFTATSAASAAAVASTAPTPPAAATTVATTAAAAAAVAGAATGARVRGCGWMHACSVAAQALSLASDACFRFSQAPPSYGTCTPFTGTGRIQVQCEVYIVANQTIKTGTINKESGLGLVLPGTACTRNTYMGLYLKSAMGALGSPNGRVAYNDDAAGTGTLCSFISYKAVDTGVFVIQGGCYDLFTGPDQDYCSGTIAWLLQ